MKVEFFVATNHDKLLNQFTKVENFRKWQTSVEDCSIKIITENKWQTYVSFDLPWPMKSKDLITQNELYQTEKYSLIKMKSIPTAMPIFKDRNHIQSLYSEWKFIAENNGITKVIYTTYTQDEPEFPRSITDPIIQKRIILSINLLKIQLS